MNSSSSSSTSQISIESDLSFWENKLEARGHKISTPANYYVSDLQNSVSGGQFTAQPSVNGGLRYSPQQMPVAGGTYPHQLRPHGGLYPQSQLADRRALPITWSQSLSAEQYQQLADRGAVAVAWGEPSSSQQILPTTQANPIYYPHTANAVVDQSDIHPQHQLRQQPTNSNRQLAHQQLMTASCSDMAMPTAVLIGGVPFYLLEAAPAASPPAANSCVGLYEDVDGDYNNVVTLREPVAYLPAGNRRISRALPLIPME